MTQDQEQAWQRDAVRRYAGAPWPLVERRLQTRPFELGNPLIRLPRVRVPAEAASTSPTPEAVGRILSGDSRSRARHRAPVLLGDLLGVVLLLLAAAGASPPTLAVPLLWCLALVLAELTAPGQEVSAPRRVLQAGAVLLVALPFVAYAAGTDLPRTLVLGALPGAVLLSATGRTLPGSRAETPRVVLVGSPESVVPTRALLVRGGAAVRVVGICCPSPSTAPTSIAGIPVVGDLDELAPTVWRGGVDVVVVCSTAETSGPVLRRIVWDLEGSGASVLVAPGIVELGLDRLHLTSLAGLPMLGVQDWVHTRSARTLKHGVDRVAAAVGLAVLLPLLVIVGLAVRWSTPGPALFRQVRVGENGRTFTLLKFRSMHVDAEERLHRLQEQNKHAHGPLFKVEDDPRVTPVGRLLRRTSLDELPQLLNVLRGDMSLVGPRPPLPSEVSNYSDPIPRRLMVRPGLTGLWQVSGRSDLSWDESARLDLYYVENWSPRLDLSILWRTFGAVVRGRGAY